MPTDQHTDTLVASQLAREAAAAWAKSNSRHQQAANIRRGSCDAAPIVQAFARFEAQLRSIPQAQCTDLADDACDCIDAAGERQ